MSHDVNPYLCMDICHIHRVVSCHCIILGTGILLSDGAEKCLKLFDKMHKKIQHRQELHGL